MDGWIGKDMQPNSIPNSENPEKDGYHTNFF
jgi:hypothetical protein